jgi:hypothetical protein
MAIRSECPHAHEGSPMQRLNESRRDRTTTRRVAIAFCCRGCIFASIVKILHGALCWLFWQDGLGTRAAISHCAVNIQEVSADLEHVASVLHSHDSLVTTACAVKRRWIASLNVALLILDCFSFIATHEWSASRYSTYLLALPPEQHIPHVQDP